MCQPWQKPWQCLYAGVDRSQVFELLGQGSADSFALRRHGAFMTSGEYPDDRFPTSYSAKDLDYALALANDLGKLTPLERAQF